MPVFFSEKSPRNPEACLVPRFGCCNYSCKPHCLFSLAIFRVSWYSRPRAANRLNRSLGLCKAPNGATCKQAASHELEQKPKRGRQHHIYSFENVTMPESSVCKAATTKKPIRCTQFLSISTRANSFRVHLKSRVFRK